MRTRDWPFCPLPGENELLSSFLVRNALVHSTTPYRFYSYHFPKTPIWNRDIDTSVSDDLLAQIAIKSGIPVETISGLSLRKFDDLRGER